MMAEPVALIPRHDRDRHNLAAGRALGPILIGEHCIVRLDCEPLGDRLPAAWREMMALYLVLDGTVELRTASTRATGIVGDVLLLDLARRWTIDSPAGVRCHTILMPRTFLAQSVPEDIGTGVFRASVGFGAIANFVAGLIAMDMEPSPAEEWLALGAMRYMLAAAFAPLVLADRTIATREAGLLDRATVYIDAHAADPLEVNRLCAALGCSRSALYRAAAPAGGIAELVARRRLAAVHRCLGDPDDRRAIGTIAAANGFAHAAQFSRSFRRTFGMSARQVRTAQKRFGGGAAVPSAGLGPFAALADVWQDVRRPGG